MNIKTPFNSNNFQIYPLKSPKIFNKFIPGSSYFFCLSHFLFFNFFIFFVFNLDKVSTQESEDEPYHDGITAPIEGLRSITLQTTDGILQGITRKGIVEEEYLFKEVDWFLGIPYAKPPIGALRFKKPESVEKWTGTRKALVYGATCLMSMDPGHVRLGYNTNEDCLFLNVFTPLTQLLERERIDGDKHRNLIETNEPPPYLLPVMFFIHGGSYEFGSGNMYVGDTLAQFGVVVVTINYRLGMLGFLSAGSNHLKGNYGLHDQIAALRWVRDNIAYFGGDPRRVTVFGNSAGAASVGILSLSPVAKGLFKQAIIQSGSPLAYWSYYRENEVDLKKRFNHIAYLANCSSNNGSGKGDIGGSSSSSGGGGSSNDGGGSSSVSSDGENSGDEDKDIEEKVECLRKLKGNDLIIANYFERGLQSIKPTEDDDIPCIDGEVVTATLEEAFRNQLFHVDNLMIGIVSNEWSRHIFIYSGAYKKDMGIQSDLGEFSCNYGDDDERKMDIYKDLGDLYKNTFKHILGRKLSYSQQLVDLAHDIYFPKSLKNESLIVDQYLKFVSDISFLVPSVNYARLVNDNSNDSQVYFYVYNHFSDECQITWQNNFHSIELNYIFGCPYRRNHVYFENLRDYREEDMEASLYAMKLWTNFAKTGDPKRSIDEGTSVDLHWEKFNGDTLNYANISVPEKSQVGENLRSHYVEFWNKVAPRMNDLALQNERNVRKLESLSKGETSRYDAVYIVAIVSLIAVVAALSIALCSLCLKSQLKDDEA